MLKFISLTGAHVQPWFYLLSHLCPMQGLSCLDDSVVKKPPDPEPVPSKHTVEPQKHCNPSEAIPLRYESLDQTKNKKHSAIHREGLVANHSTSAKVSTNSDADTWSPDIDPSEAHNQVSVFTRISLPVGSWHCLSKTLLLRKAAVSYYGLADCRMSAQKYGQSLKYIKLGLVCFGK